MFPACHQDLHFALYIIIRLCEEGIEKKEAFYNILTSIGFYLGIILIFEIIHYYKEERDRFKLLYNNIVQYSFQEREYMISQNRSKISQELHDSLGHLLMGAMLNIKYLKENNKNKDDIKIDISVGDKVSVDMVSEYMIVGENAIFETGLINISPIPEKQTNTTS